MSAQELIERLRNMHPGENMDMPAIRAAIHEEHARAGFDERGKLLAIYNAVMDNAERQIQAVDLEKYREARRQDYMPSPRARDVDRGKRVA